LSEIKLRALCAAFVMSMTPSLTALTPPGRHQLRPLQRSPQSPEFHRSPLHPEPLVGISREAGGAPLAADAAASPSRAPERWIKSGRARGIAAWVTDPDNQFPPRHCLSEGTFWMGAAN